MQHGRAVGTVRWFSGDKGYGYLQAQDGTPVFVHHRAIAGEGFPTLHAGQRVTFTVGDDGRGPTAEDVRLDGDARGDGA